MVPRSAKSLKSKSTARKTQKFCFLIWRDIAHTWDGGSQAPTSVPLLRYSLRGTVLCTVMHALFQRKRPAVSVPTQLLAANVPVIDAAEIAALDYCGMEMASPSCQPPACHWGCFLMLRMMLQPSRYRPMPPCC